jgi:hypothetical protein
MTGAIANQPSWTSRTDFSSQYFPGVILLAIVGGSALIAACAAVKGAPAWQLSSIVAGVIMVVWIIGEIASIRAFHILQVIYLATGAAVLWLTPQERPAAP